AGLEGADFADGVPKGSSPLRLVTGSAGGFVTARGGLLGKERALELHVAVNCCHGGPGEDGTLQGVLDSAGVRYTGPTVAGAAIGMDKLAFGALVDAAGLPSLPRVALTAGTDKLEFEGPYIVKPRFGGSSIGIDVVEDLETARQRLSRNVHLAAGAVVEPYRPGSVDLEIALRAFPSLQLSAIDKPERVTAGGEILSYRDKYVGGEGMSSAPRQLPARIDPAVGARVREAATVVADLVDVRGIARLDFLLEGDDLYVNEINTIPGSLSWHMWVDPAIPFATLLSDMLEEAARRPSIRYSTAGADGTALRSAGTIQGKLG
ncbi:MAG TPA: hypothetical protein VF954_02400, partial [Acidimicrobiales bacterium]